MFGALNTGTLNTGLNIGRRLIATGNVQSSLPLLRELFAGAVNSNRPAASSDILPQIEKWIVPIAQQKLLGGRDIYSDRLSRIIADLTSYGFADEAIRVLVTAIGLDPANSAWLVAAAKKAFDGPVIRSPAKAAEAASGLMDVGMRYLKSGAVDGIALMGAAHRVGQIPLPVADIGASLDSVPDGKVDWTYTAATDAQALTDYAYDLRRDGSLKTAVGVGMLIPPMLGAPLEINMMDELASSAGTGNAAAIDASRGMMAKGYGPQAAEVLMASDAVSPMTVWNTLNSAVIGPSAQVNAPHVLISLTRNVTNTVTNAVTSPALNPAPVKLANESLYLALEGKGVHCDEAEWNAEFDLLFNYDSPPLDVLTTFKGKKFEVLKNSEATLRIMVDPVGFTLSDGVAARDVKFKDGKMLDGPPRFKLKAPAKSSGDHSKAGVTITFSINRNAIYDFFLPIKLVDQIGSEPCANPSLDLDLADVVAGASRPRDAQVFIYSDADAWKLAWDIKNDRQEVEKVTKLSAAKLSNAYKENFFAESIAAVAQNAAWRSVDENLALPNEDEFRAFAIKSIEDVKKAGIKLHKILCQEPLLEKLLTRIDQLPDGSRITFKTDDVVFPWELIYTPNSASGKDSANPYYRFWGARFHIESLLVVRDGKEKIPAPPRQPGPLRVSMGLNTSIDQEDPWKDDPPGPVARQTQYLDACFRDRGNYFGQYDDIVNILTHADPASMIYFYCHGSASSLVFDRTNPPITALEVGGPGYPGWPIIFINACDAGNISPLSFISFRTEFRKKGAAGVIAPSFPIPTLFAAYFGKAVLTEYDKRRPIGEIIFELRRQLLDQNNPLGLWYSIQCPLDVTAPVA